MYVFEFIYLFDFCISFVAYSNYEQQKTLALIARVSLKSNI